MLFRGQTLGKYKITAPLGSGGFGAVYLARDTWIDKDVAIKVPHRQNMNFGELLAGASTAGGPRPPQHHFDHDGREAGQRLLHRDGIRRRPHAGGPHHHQRKPRRGACRRLRQTDWPGYRARPCAGSYPPRPATGQHARLRRRRAQGRRLRHVTLPGDRRARHDGHRQPAVHGARAVRRQGGLRLGHLFAGHHDVPDAHRGAAVRVPPPPAISRSSGAASWCGRRASPIPTCRRPSTTS